jgi:hypothetical protein
MASEDDNGEGSSMVTDDSIDKYEAPPDSEFPEGYIFFKENDHVVQAQSQRSFVQLREQETKQMWGLDRLKQRFVFCWGQLFYFCSNSHVFV